MDDEFGDGGADASFDAGGDSSVEDMSVDVSSDSADSLGDSGDSGSEDMAEAIPEDPPSESEADDGDCVGSDEAPDAIAELPPDDGSGVDSSDILADPPPDDGVDSGEDGGAVDLNEDELEDEVSSEVADEPVSESSEPSPSELAGDSEGDSNESAAEDSSEGEMISAETLPEDSTDSVGENEEGPSESLPIDEAEQQAEGEEQGAGADAEQAAEDNVITVDEDGHIEGAGYDSETMHEEIGHQDLQDIEDDRNLSRSEILAEDSGMNTAEGGLDALDASLSEQGKSDRIDAVDDMADKMREYEIAQGHHADYTEDADALASSEQQRDEVTEQSTAVTEQTGDDARIGGLKDVLSEASERGGEVSADDVPPPNSEGRDENDRFSQRDAVVDAYERRQAQNSR